VTVGADGAADRPPASPLRPGTLVGTRIARRQDPALLVGGGRFVDDIELPGMLHAAFVRSQVAHGKLTRFDATRASRMPGVVKVIGPDETAGCGRLPCVWIMTGQRLTSYPLVPEVVRYVGEQLGVVVGSSRAAAEDGTDEVEIDVDPLPVVVDLDDALRGDVLLFPEWRTNVVAQKALGDERDAVERALASASHRISVRVTLGRHTGNSLEPRGLVASYDRPTGQLTVWMSTQGAHHVREHLAVVLGMPADRIRVITPDVGGGFGMKDHLYPDEALVCLAAVQLGVPVKWIADRRESLLSDNHARDQVIDLTVGVDEQLRFTALTGKVTCNVGAYTTNVGAGPPWVTTMMLEGPYRFPLMRAEMRAVVTNKAPIGAYRGFGMQQATFARERMVDEVARQIGADALALRRANMIQPEEMPFTTRSESVYDSGDYPHSLAEAERLIASGGPPASDGRRRGVGYACYVEFTGLGPVWLQQVSNFNLNGYESVTTRMEPDGSLTVQAGVSAMGQGIETTLAQLVADQLHLPLEQVRVELGDTASTPYSSAGSIASRSMVVSGGAAVKASVRLREKLIAIAAHRLEADPRDVVLEEDSVSVRGVPTSAVPVRTIAREAWLGWNLPPDMEPGLEARAVFDPPNISFSYATHAAVVAVDPETGEIEIERYVVVHDCGVRVNPAIVDGQIVGGVAQGVGAAVLEAMVHDPAGQPLTTTYLDYLLPTSAEVPDVTLGHIETPSPFVPGGMKGVGEGGTIAPPAAIANAVAAALPEVASRITEIPLGPAVVWSLLHDES
jgi:carbon-monoxide dehydrogenase large subunit